MLPEQVRGGVLLMRAAVLLCLAAGAAASPPVITHRSTVALPGTTTDQFGAGFTITGLSGLAYRGGDEFVAVMDNSNKLVRLAVTLSANGTATQVSVLGGISLAQTQDFEGLAIDGGTVYISEEGTPAVRSFDLATGAAIATLPTPPVFANRRANNGFESLARMPDGTTMWTANEQALTVDGPAATESIGTVVRLLRYVNSVPGAQFAYNAEPMHGTPISGSKAGVCEMTALPDGRLLVMERSLAFSLSGLFLTRIYLVDVAGATDVSASPGLIAQSYTAAAKALVYSGSHANLEGLCIGPRLGPGRYALLGIVDDGDPVSVNELVAFEIRGVDPCYANCDGSTLLPALNVQDFACFLNAFAAGDPYANCDASTAAPALNVQDFSCFLNDFAAGCT